MSTKNPKENPIKFNCEKCNFKCCNKKDYTRHLNTLKHKNQQNQHKKPQKTPKSVLNRLSCVCGKSYKDRSGLWRHKKVCNNANENVITDIECKEYTDNSRFLSLISQNKELMDLLHEQNKIIKEIVPKIGNNNNNNNTTNNHFNLNVFLNEDCKDAINFSEFIDSIKVTFEDLEHQAEVGYIKGISKLFIENLQELGTHKRPIHCTDRKRKTLYIKENNEWDKEGSQNTLKKGIREVSRKGFECLMKEKQENQEEYKDIESDFTQKCLSIHRNILPGVPQETTISKVIEKISQNSGINE